MGISVRYKSYGSLEIMRASGDPVGHEYRFPDSIPPIRLAPRDMNCDAQSRFSLDSIHGYQPDGAYLRAILGVTS